MTQSYTVNTSKPLFARRHYKWLAEVAKAWQPSTQIALAYELYCDNSNFKAVRWFQAAGYDRQQAENLAEVVQRMFNNGGSNG